MIDEYAMIILKFKFIIILNVDTYEEDKISKYIINKFISIRDNINMGIIFWIDRNKNKISQSKNIEIEIIHKWNGGDPNLIINPKIRVILKKLNW